MFFCGEIEIMNKLYYSSYRPLLTDKNFTDLNPIDCGWASCCPMTQNVMMRNHYIIHYIVKGSGEVICKNKTYDVKAGEIFIIKPNIPLTYTASKNDPWEYIWISFNGRLSERFSEINNVVLPFEKSIFFDMKKCNSYASLKEEFLTAKLFELYAEFFSDGGKYNTAHIAANYIDHSYGEEISISQLAKDMKTDRHHLSRIFKKEFGITMQDYLITKRLHEAKKLLKAGFNVTQTAFAVGYKDPFVFSKAFKKKYGVAPKELRKK